MYGPSKYHWGMELFRSFFSVIDTVIYFVISGIYQVFFNIANSTLISGEVIKAFFTRVQLILGIIILFKLSISLISGIINPDTMTDAKGGFSKIVTRIVTALIMLILIVPLNIPEEAITDGSYEAQLNNNGILFGTMYEFQSRILSQNTLAKLILSKDVSMSESTTNDSMADAGRDLASTILKTFITVNLESEEAEGRIKTTADYLEPSNRMCKDDDSTDIIDTYLLTNNVRTILNLTSNYCGSSGVAGIGSNGYFVFNYSFLISTIVGILFIVIMAGFTLDMAIRAFKLAILRLIAPVPIISYIDPKSDNGAFGAWSKTVMSTYIDIFIRVAIVYFIIFVIDSISHTGIVIEVATGPIGLFSYLFIFLGLFFFAKEAPKFITDSLGIKNPKGIFSGVGRMLGLGAAVAGISGSAMSNYRASKEENDQLHEGQKWRNRARNIGSAAVGGIAGAYTGTRAAVNAKDHHMTEVIKAMSTRNTLRSNHSTLPGRIADSASSIFAGRSLAALDDGVAKLNQAAADALKAYKSMMQEEAKKNRTMTGDVEVRANILDGSGNVIGQAATATHSFNYEKLVAAMNSKDDNGNFIYDGTSYNVSQFDANAMNDVLDHQSEQFQRWAFANPTDSKAGKIMTQWRNTEYAVRAAGIQFNGEYEHIGKNIGIASSALADMNADMTHVRRRANQQANKNK